MFFLNFLFEAFENKYFIIAERVLNAVIFFVDLIINRSASVGSRDQPRTWISPAPWAFSIWSKFAKFNTKVLIYTALFIFVGYQLLPRSFNSRIINNGVHFYFAIATLLNMVWLIVWPKGNYCASFVIIFLLWQVLALIYVKIANSSEADNQSDRLEAEDSEISPLLDHQVEPEPYLIVYIPFSMYFAWLTCATVVSLFITFLPISESDPYQTIPFAIVAIFALMFISVLFVYVQKDIIFGMVIAWALFGISQGSQLKKWPGKEANWIYFSSMGASIILIVLITFVIGRKCVLRYFNRSD